MATHVVDMNTVEGLTEHLSSLPSANLETIAARPVWNADSALLVTTAAFILAARESGLV